MSVNTLNKVISWFQFSILWSFFFFFKGLKLMNNPNIFKYFVRANNHILKYGDLKGSKPLNKLNKCPNICISSQNLKIKVSQLWTLFCLQCLFFIKEPFGWGRTLCIGICMEKSLFKMLVWTIGNYIRIDWIGRISRIGRELYTSALLI